MFLLEFVQEEYENNVGLFETLEDGREFVSSLPGYYYINEDGFFEEYIDAKSLDFYTEYEFNGNIFPLTSLSYDKSEPILIVWHELTNFSKEGNGLIPGAGKVDAYIVEHNKMKEYIEKRQKGIKEMRDILENRGMEAKTFHYGSQDGEAIYYKKKNENDWHFLTHIDPFFLEEENKENYLE